MTDELDAPWLSPAPPIKRADLQNARTVAEYPAYTAEALEGIANEALYKLACAVHDDPMAFKPNEAIAIVREALDRTRGRAAQTVTLDTKATVTHEHVMSISPADAYRLLSYGGVQVTGLPVIDATPIQAGGDAAEQPVGVNVAEAPPQIYHEFLKGD